jgi:hypothetical protein
MNKYIGKKFNARKNYPFVERRGKRSEEQMESEIIDIKYGEKILVSDYDADNSRYKLINLELENESAWVTVTEEELLKLKGRS